MRTLLTASALVILFSCKKETSITTTSTVTVAFDSCTVQSGDNLNFQICYDSLLEDSRCPINANCIWQGVAKAKFRFKVNAQEHVVRLSTLDLAPHYTIDTTVGGYHLKLINVLPYPVYPNNPQAHYTAIVEVTQ